MKHWALFPFLVKCTIWRPCLLKTEFFRFLDLNKIYLSKDLDPEISPKNLQNKVIWDIRFYFARRGSENMYGMEKDHFKLTFDQERNICCGMYIPRCDHFGLAQQI